MCYSIDLWQFYPKLDCCIEVGSLREGRYPVSKPTRLRGLVMTQHQTYHTRGWHCSWVLLTLDLSDTTTRSCQWQQEKCLTTWPWNLKCLTNWPRNLLVCWDDGLNSGLYEAHILVGEAREIQTLFNVPRQRLEFQYVHLDVYRNTWRHNWAFDQ